MIDCRGIACEIASKWTSMDFTDDKSALVYLMVTPNVDQYLCRHIASLRHTKWSGLSSQLQLNSLWNQSPSYVKCHFDIVVLYVQTQY